MLACTDGGSQASPQLRDVAAERGLDARAPEEDYEPPDQPTLLRGHAPLGELHEVVLDPSGSAALTLDTAGTVQLWPALASEAPDDGRKTWPMTLPLQDPLWLSFAKTRTTYADGSFLLATIDTSNALQVFAIASVEDKPASVWQLERRFALPPKDPILEAHVLAGGERIVALAEDHSIRLYDDKGTLVAQLTQPGFVPWQLRVGSMDEAGRVGMVAMLTQPLRVQSVVLTGDQLRLEGEPRSVELDRGPNRNDLELSPDGRTIAALRRAYGKGKNWSVELIDLASDERKLIAGKVDVTVRPRMHYVDDARLLLESGRGKGYWVDLVKAKPLRKPEDADPESSFAKSMADRMADEHAKVPLPGALERLEDLPDDDRGLRFQSTTAGGIRAAVDDTGVLIIDPLDHPHHLELGFRSAVYSEVALQGELVVLADHEFGRENRLIFFDTNLIKNATWPQPQVVPRQLIGGTILELEFVRNETLLAIVRTPARVNVHVYAEHEDRWGQSAILTLPVIGGDLKTVAVHVDDDDANVAIVGTMTISDQRLLAFVDVAQETLEVRELGKDDHPMWPELLTPAELAAITGHDEHAFQSTHAQLRDSTIQPGGVMTIFTHEGDLAAHGTRSSPNGAPLWSTPIPGYLDAIEPNFLESLVAVRSHVEATIAEHRDEQMFWLFLDAKTGARLWTMEASASDNLAWEVYYTRNDVELELDRVVLTHRDAIEIVDIGTGERLSYVRGLGPAWRSVPDEQATTRFSSEHVNTQPLTVRPPSN